MTVKQTVKSAQQSTKKEITFYANCILLALLIIGYALKYLFYAFLSRHIGPESYGDINIIIKTMNLAVPIVMLGLNTSLLRWLPTMIVNKEYAKISGFLRLVTYILFFASFVAIILGAFFAFIVHLNHKPSAVGVNYPGFLALFLLPVAAVSVFFNGLLKCYKKYYFAVFSYNIAYYLIGFVLLFFAFYVFDQANFYAAFLMTIAAYFFLVILQLTKLYKPIVVQYVKHRQSIERKKIDPKWLKLSFVFLLSGLVYKASVSIDLIMLELLSSSEAQVGYFSAITTIAWFVLLISRASNVIFMPRISQYYDSGEINKLQNMLNTCFFFNLLFGLCFSGIVFAFGHALLSHFGPGYATHHQLLMVVTIGAFFINQTENSATMLVFTDFCNKVVIIESIALACAVLLDIVFIPVYGMYGAAISLLVVTFLSNLIKAIMVKHLLKLKPFFVF